MTDNEIIKAMESIASASIGDCKRDCAFYDGKVHFCGGIVAKHSLDIINRQKAEIERLQSNLKFVRGTVKRMREYDEERDIRLHARLVRTAKAEAIKEFADRLSLMLPCTEDIDNLVKEMTEEEHDGKS